MLGSGSAVYVQIETRDGAVHVLVAEKVYVIGIKLCEFLENLVFTENIHMKNNIKNVGLGVKTRNSFRPFLRVFQWEYYLVVCALLIHYYWDVHALNKM